MTTGKFVRFQTTFWPKVEAAKAGDRAALEELIRSCHPVLASFARAQGLGDADAADAAQEVCLQLCRAEFLARIDAAKGRFRSLLLAVSRHVIQGIRRGQRKLPPAELAPPPEAERDETFDRLWASGLLARAMERLKSDRRREPYEAFEMRHVQGLPYKQIAERMGRSVSDVSNYVQRAKTRLRKFLRAEVEQYAATQAEYEEDTALLMRLLDREAER